MVRVGCPAHNCGGRCVLLATVSGGRIVRLEADDRPDVLEAPQLRACARGRAYLRRQYHPDRLLHPLKRVGKRGEGKFVRVSWDEALDLVASQMRRVRETYGPGALFVPYGTGSYNQTNGSHVARRLMNVAGGCLGIWNSYSWAAINVATPTVYGTLTTGNQRQDWLNAKLILMWGWNPAEMRDGTNSDFFLKLARERGARVVCIDPRHSLSAASLADEWVPIRPGTDAALMTAMAYVMVTEGLYDAEFVRTHCVGFDASQMPPGVRGGGELSRLPPRREGRRPEDARVGRADHHRAARDDRPPRAGVRDVGPGRPLPGLRDAATGVRRAGRPGRLRPGGARGERRDPRRLGLGPREPGARRRPLLDRLPDRREPVRRGDPVLPLDRGGPEGPRDGGGGRRRLLGNRRAGARRPARRRGYSDPRQGGPRLRRAASGPT
ncbi:MAG: molybdopterin-dependent oxidoreductase [Holophagales bacterium]|nr:molybdopterin-dependent oxidoreductase [Holophagales bacterium]